MDSIISVTTIVDSTTPRESTRPASFPFYFVLMVVATIVAAARKQAEDAKEMNKEPVRLLT